MAFNSIKSKLFILYVGILAAILIIYKSVSDFSSYYKYYATFDERLRQKAQEISNTIKSYLDVIGYNKESLMFAVKRVILFEGESENLSKIEKLEQSWRQNAANLNLKEDYVNFLSRKGKLIAGVRQMDDALFLFFKKDLTAIKDKGIFTNISFGNSMNLRVISMPFFYNTKSEYIIQVGSNFKPFIQILRERLFQTVIVIAVILVFAGFVGWIFIVRILSPVVKITKTAKDITYENLNARVKIDNADEEMKYLADAFNDMISRLEQSFQYVAEFSSHVAHELKTPLAIIKGESELALRRERGVEEYKRVITVHLEETERMLKIIDDLLLLTRLDYQSEQFKFEQFDLVEFLEQICQQCGVLASQKNITLNVDIHQKNININANKLNLRRLFFNLIDNAVKFTPENGGINIAVKCDIKKVKISIEDTGPGISEEDLPRIFKRFYRVESPIPGYGLGLSIVQSIAKIHQGEVEVKSQIGKGSTFTVILPIP